MRLCVGTSKGIVIVDPARGAPVMVLADPAPVWCMAQDTADPNLIYAAANGFPYGNGAISRSTDGGRSWNDITPRISREEEIWAVATAPDRSGQVVIGTSHGRLFRSDDSGHI